MEAHRTDESAPVPAYDMFGRLGSWHSLRLLALLGWLFGYLLIPWARVPDVNADFMRQLVFVGGLIWAIPCWFAGVVASRGGVRLNYGGVVRRIRWRDIDQAKVAWCGVDPRLRIDLVDGREVWAPGFFLPLSERSSRQDGWRSTEMFRAAQLITAEAERRRAPRPPDDGIVDLVPDASRRAAAPRPVGAAA